MNTEMNTGEAIANLGRVSLGSIHPERVGVVERVKAVERVNLDLEGLRAMRHCLHELANVFTGVMIAAELLSLHLTKGPLEHYAAEICMGGERGCALVREIRSQLISACGEPEAIAKTIPEAADQGTGAALAPEA